MTATMQHGGEGSRRRAATQPASPWWHRQHHHRLAALCVCSAAAIVLLASQPCSALHNAQDAAADAALHSTQSAAWSRGRRQGGSGGVAWAATARHAAQALLGALSAASQPLAHGHSSSVLPAAADLHVAASGDGSVGDVALELQPTHGRQLLSSRVGTVGVAIFLILFFMGLCLFICLLGSRTKFPWVVYILSTLVFGIVFAVLAGSPKGPAPDKPPSGYDQTIVPMSIIMGFMCLCIVLAGLGLMIFQASPKFYARPLSHHVDVLRG